MLTAEEFKAVFEAKQVSQVTPAHQFYRIQFSRCGGYLLGAGFDGLIHRWQLTGEAPAELPGLSGHNGWVQSLRCLSQGDLVVSTDTWGQLRCGVLASDTPAVPQWTVPQAHDGWIVDLAVSPDETLLATCGHDRMVRLWQTATGERVREIAGHDVEVFAVTFAADGKSIFSGDLTGKVKQWNVADGQLIREFDATSLHLSSRLQEIGGARVLTVDQSGTRLFVGGTKPKNGGNVQGLPTVLVFQIADGALQQTHTLGVEGDVYVTELIELAAGEWLASISGNPGAGKLVAFQTGAEKPVFETKKYANCQSMAWYAPQRRLAVSTTNTGSNGNGRSLKNGEYVGNFSPVFLFTIPEPSAAAT